MKIDIVCSSATHPVNGWLKQWQEKHQHLHEVNIVRNSSDLTGGDVLFLISCTEIIEKQLRENYTNSFVLHASDLPEGRGWSPHVWEILHGARELTVSLLDADDPVDSGAVWAKAKCGVPEDALHDEINSAVFNTELLLMDRGLEMIAEGARPIPQSNAGVSYWPLRSPADSEIDPTEPLATQFDKIRVADPERYPAFFRMYGFRYKIEIRKLGKDEADHD